MNFVNWLLQLFSFSEPQPVPRVVVYRNYASGPFDFAEVS